MFRMLQWHITLPAIWEVIHPRESLTLSINWAAACQNQQTDVRRVKTPISLGIRPVWSESSLCTHRVAKDARFLHADGEDSDQTGRMPRLIRVFAGRTGHLVGFVVHRLNLLRLCHCATIRYLCNRNRNKWTGKQQNLQNEMRSQQWLW